MPKTGSTEIPEAEARTWQAVLLALARRYGPTLVIALTTFLGSVAANRGVAKDSAKEAAKVEAKSTADSVAATLAPPIVQQQQRTATVEERLTRAEATLAKVLRLLQNANMTAARQRKAEKEAQEAAAKARAAAPPPLKPLPVPDSVDKAQAQQEAAAK